MSKTKDSDRSELKGKDNEGEDSSKSRLIRPVTEPCAFLSPHPPSPPPLRFGREQDCPKGKDNKRSYPKGLALFGY